jgi:glycosyltransferase involved in cell wall biosynthesis
MHILHIHQAFVSPKEAGGTRHYEFGRHLVENGHMFTIVASDLNYLSGRRTSEHKGLSSLHQEDGVRVLRAYTYPALHRSFVWRVVSFLSFMFSSIWAGLKTKKPDLVMGTSPPIFQAVSAWLVSAVRRTPFMLEVRDLWPEFAIDMGVMKSPILIGLSRWLERFLYSQADHILVNSPAYRDYLINKGILPERVSLIPNGVDPDMFNPSEKGESFREQYGLNNKFVVTYAGALGLANDIPVLLDAAERLKDNSQIHFMLVGDGIKRTRLETVAKRRGLANVTFTGAVPKSEMKNVLAASDACVAILKNIPMFSMTYPNKVFDYMAAGRPTILAIDGVIRKVIEDSNGGVFVPPGNHLALCDAVRLIANAPDNARKMGLSAREYVVSHFNRKSHAQAFSQLVEHVSESGVHKG